jgi:predicted permease
VGRVREGIARLLGLFQKRGCEQGLDAEMRAHLEALTEENIRRGMNAEQARHAAHREFGGVEQAKERYRDQRGLPVVETLLADLRFAVRQLGRRPGITALMIVTLALGIGANTAIFSVVHAVLLAPLPYPHSDRLAIVWSVFGKEGRAPASGPEFAKLASDSRLFEEFAGIWVQSGALTGEGEPEQVRLAQVTWNFPSLLAKKPQAGRFFLPQEQGKMAAPVILLSDGLWRRRFGADPRVIGQPVRLNGQPRTIVGVMPDDFRIVFPEGSSVPPEMDAFIPFPSDLAKGAPDQSYIRIVGRLRAGVTLAQAQSEADQIATMLRSSYPDFAEQSLGLNVVPLHGDVVRNLRPALLALLAGVGFLLLIACANVANLLLSLADERRREMTVRAAVGAGRGRILRQLLTESVLLSCLSGAAALLLGWCALKLLLYLRPVELERLGAIGLDFTAMGFTFGIAVAGGLLFGLAPAIASTKINLVESLKNGATILAAGRHSRNALIVCEVALGIVLVIGAGLMLRTFNALLRSDPGMRAGSVITFHVSVASAKYWESGAAVNFFRTLQKNLAALPGVEAAGLTSHLPFDDTLPNWYSYYWPEGAAKQDQNTVMADHRSVLPGYFSGIGAVFVAGHDFDSFDVAENRAIAIVDDTVARKAWPNGDAVGQRLNVENGDFERDTVEVIGVVKHIQYHSLTDQVRGQVYLLYPRAIRQHMAFTIRSSSDPQILVPLLRQEVAKLDKDLPIYNIQSMDDYVAKARRSTRFLVWLAGAMAGIALLLACTGIYGVTSRAVSQRTNEIGVRVALGAQARDIFRVIVREGMAPVAAGVFAGLVLSLLLTPLITSLLFGVRPADFGTFLASSIFLAGVGLLACYFPARRAIRVDPLVALRYE